MPEWFNDWVGPILLTALLFISIIALILLLVWTIQNLKEDERGDE